MFSLLTCITCLIPIWLLISLPHRLLNWRHKWATVDWYWKQIAVVTLITLIGWLWIPLGTGRGCQMLISLSGHPWSMWQSKYVVYLKLVMDLSCIPLQWTNTAKQFQKLMDKRFLGVQKVTSVFEKQTYGPILPWYCKQLLLLKTRQDQWQIQGRGPPPPPLFLDQTEG